MGDVTQVDIDALRTATGIFDKFADRLRAEAIPAVAKTPLPSVAIPATDMGFAGNYSQAYTAMDMTCSLTCNVMHTISLSLTRVANHYEGQEAKNAEMFGNQPIPQPEAPAAVKMPGDTSGAVALFGSGVVIGAVGGAMTMITLALAGLAVSSARFGGAVFIVPFGIFASCNLRWPEPYFHASGGWSEIQTVFADASPALGAAAHAVNADAGWIGDGADAFNSYITNVLVPMIDMAKGLAGDVALACVEAGIGMVVAVGMFIVATITACKICLAASSVPPPGDVVTQPVVWATLSMWGMYIAEIIIDLIATFGALALSVGSISNSYNNLAGWLKDEAGNLNGKAGNLTPVDTQRLQDYQGWTQ